MFNFNNLTRVTKGLLIINIVVFAITKLVNADFFYTEFSAYYPQSPNFKAWQIITHMFMHANFMHILFNMIGLLSFGPVLENILGEKKFFYFYFASGFGAFLLFNMVNFYQIQGLIHSVEASGINPAEIFLKSKFGYSGDLSSINTNESIALFNALKTPMVGASGAIFGVVTAFGILFPNSKLIIFPIPIPIKAKYILTVVIIGSIFLGIQQMGNDNGDNIAHFAHLGGALVGFIWISIWKKNRFKNNL